MFRIVSIGLMLVVLLACTHDKVAPFRKYETRNVIVIVIDGPRYSETWGDPLRVNIPVRDSLFPEGVLLTNFMNNGETRTVPGHTGICTGNYQAIANNGTQLPDFPSFFQAWRKYTGEAATQCCIVGSKDKLHVLSNCLYEGYQDCYRPYFNVGVNGDGTGGYRADSITLAKALSTLSLYQPKMMLIAFKDPDYYGHLADSAAYIQAIRKTDRYIADIWNYIQSNPKYKDKTTLLVTNDHGRHLDGVADGYISHGDNCEGCRHIELFALSPDFKRQVQVNVPYDQLDISATISEMLHFPFYKGKGTVMKELFK